MELESLLRHGSGGPKRHRSMKSGRRGPAADLIPLTKFRARNAHEALQETERRAQTIDTLREFFARPLLYGIQR